MNEERKIRTVTVTGAGGTVGGYVVDLLLERGYGVIAVDRPKTLESLKKRAIITGQKGLAVVEGDLRKNESTYKFLIPPYDTRDSIFDVDAIIHLAADLDIRKSYLDMVDINVRAPMKLFEELKEARGRVFIHFSSGSIYGDCDSGELEETSPVKGKSGYECSKIESEENLKVLAGFCGSPKLIIVRPALIYGPKGRFLASGVMALPPVLQFVFNGFSPRMSGGPRTNLVHAEDVARAVVFLLENENKVKSGEIFNVADDTPMGFGDVCDAAAEAYGLTRAFGVPIPPAKMLALLKRIIDTDLFFKLFDAPIDVMWWLICKQHGIRANFSARFEREMAAYFVKDTVFSNKKIKQFGFQFKYPSVREGMKNVVSWYKENGWIPQKVRPFWRARG